MICDVNNTGLTHRKRGCSSKAFRGISTCAAHYSFAAQEKAKEFILYSAGAINRINGLAVEIPYCFLSYC